MADRHIVNWWRLEGGPWVCHLCHPNPHGALHVTAFEARRVVQITLRQAAAFARRRRPAEPAVFPT